jgi:4a-hydroxytetrahydrobiopterin dehydratase
MSRLIDFIKDTDKKRIPEKGFEYLLNLNESTIPDERLPVDVSSGNWDTIQDPERIIRRFEFETFNKLKYFIDTILDFQERTNHHANIDIRFRDVIVTSFTHDIERVTELDLELAKFCDEVYDDTRFIGSEY